MNATANARWKRGSPASRTITQQRFGWHLLQPGLGPAASIPDEHADSVQDAA